MFSFKNLARLGMVYRREGPSWSNLLLWFDRIVQYPPPLTSAVRNSRHTVLYPWFFFAMSDEWMKKLGCWLAGTFRHELQGTLFISFLSLPPHPHARDHPWSTEGGLHWKATRWECMLKSASKCTSYFPCMFIAYRRLYRENRKFFSGIWVP